MQRKEQRKEQREEEQREEEQREEGEREREQREQEEDPFFFCVILQKVDRIWDAFYSNDTGTASLDQPPPSVFIGSPPYILNEDESISCSSGAVGGARVASSNPPPDILVPGASKNAAWNDLP